MLSVGLILNILNATASLQVEDQSHLGNVSVQAAAEYLS